MPQLSVESPVSWLNETLALSLSVLLSILTDPEELGQPVPEKTRDVMRGGLGGAASVSSGSPRVAGRRERIATVL